MQLKRTLLVLAGLLALSACQGASGPAGQPSSTDVNPISGNRGGSGSK